MEKTTSSSFNLKRRSSLNNLNVVLEEENSSLQEEETNSSFNLKHLEGIANKLTKNCNNHEHKIGILEHDIEQKIKEWDTIINQLRKLDDDAQNLTDQIQNSIETLKSTPIQIAASKTSTKNVNERINHLKNKFEITSKEINSSLKVLDKLEMSLVEEEGSLAAEAKQSGRSMRLFIYVLSAISIVFLAWYYSQLLATG